MRKGENFYKSFLKNIIAVGDLGIVLDAWNPVLNGLSFVKLSMCLWAAQSSRSQNTVFYEVILDSS